MHLCASSCLLCEFFWTLFISPLLTRSLMYPQEGRGDPHSKTSSGMGETLISDVIYFFHFQIVIITIIRNYHFIPTGAFHSVSYFIFIITASMSVIVTVSTGVYIIFIKYIYLNFQWVVCSDVSSRVLCGVMSGFCFNYLIYILLIHSLSTGLVVLCPRCGE